MLGKLFEFFRNRQSSAVVSKTPSAVTGFEDADLLIAEGNRAEQTGDLPGACEHYRKAAQIAPQYAKAHFNLAFGLEASGQIDQACKCYEVALGIDPGNIYANFNLGRQLFSRKAFTEAEFLLRRAIAGNPDFADARVLMSALLQAKLDLEGAVVELEQALRIRPDHFATLCSYADLLWKLNRPDETVSALRSAVAAQPGDYDANFSLARLLVELNKPVEAEQFLQQALRIKPDSLDARALLVNLFVSRGDLQNAASAAQAALELHPDWLDLLYNYGLILKRLKRLSEAETVFRQAIATDRTYVRGYHMLGAVLITQCRIQEALDVLRDGQNHCADSFALKSSELFALTCQDGISNETVFARHVAFGRHIEQLYPARFGPFDHIRDPDRLLRIGYVSGDFQRHVIPLFVLPLLEEHDRSQFEVHCYSTGDTSDHVTEQLKSLADAWHSAGRMSPDELADQIHADRIDILIDLAGHSGIPNLQTFARQPAPVQATWAGYLGTTGMTRIQYRISDHFCDPPGLTERYHTERLLRLPNSQWCYRPFVEVEYQSEAPMIRNGHVTFGSFNQTAKITPTVRKLWGQILTQVPDSRLVIVGVADNQTRDTLWQDLENAGIERSRVAMFTYVPVEDYYRWFSRVDIALDTMPYSGGTTTCDAIIMGTPVITCPGPCSSSRSAGSILNTLGLNDWIAESPEDYVRRAVQFANNSATIAQLHATLRSIMIESPLMDQRRFTRDMESGFRQMWKTWCAQTGE